MRRPDCKYFNRKNNDKDNITSYFDEDHLICDNYACVANGGKFFSSYVEAYIGFCDVNGRESELSKLKGLKQINPF